MSHLVTIRRRAFPAGELLLGLFLAEVIAIFQVHASNRLLHDRMAAVAAAGFLPVPNEHVWPALLGWDAAVCGGLLFTLSVGAGLSLLAILAAWVCGRSGLAVGLSAGMLAGLLVLMNSRGLDLWVSLYFLVIPPLVFLPAHRFLSGPAGAAARRSLALRLLGLLVVAGAWAGQYNTQLFIDLRDHLLMSNAPGRAVSDFYYRYTLYPAEVFKSLDQKLIRTAAPTPGAPRPAVLEQVLVRNDYLPIAGPTPADVELHATGDRVVFVQSGRTLLEEPVARFTADPRSALSDISTRADRWGPFRAFTFYAVLLAFPTTLFLLLVAGLRVLTGPLMPGTGGEILGLAACVFVGVGILVFFHSQRIVPPEPAELEHYLQSPRWPDRVAALKVARDRKIDPLTLAGVADLQQSSEVPERYYLARALAAAHDPSTAGRLQQLLDDSSINVRTMALESLGQRRDRAAIPAILSFLKQSRTWYDQMYAYQALRALGWNQAQSR